MTPPQDENGWVYSGLGRLHLGASATELTPETWDDAVDGKTVFIKFLAPW